MKDLDATTRAKKLLLIKRIKHVLSSGYHRSENKISSKIITAQCKFFNHRDGTACTSLSYINSTLPADSWESAEDFVIQL